MFLNDLSLRMKMGWLFGKKKEVPFPEGKMVNENALKFSVHGGGEKVIEPDRIKEAAGVEKPFFFNRERAEESPAPHFPLEAPPVAGSVSPLYIKVDVYQHMLGELQELRGKLNDLHQLHQHLETSEYNEEHNFVKLRRAVKSMHDTLLQVDKVLFKG